MKKMILPILLCALVLSACGADPDTSEPAVTVSAATPEAVPTISVTVPVEETTEPAEVPTEPDHSALYIPGVDVEDVIIWFNEVCLAAEYVHSGDPSFLQKWDTPIIYCVQGSPTDYDLEVLESFAQWLNTLEGFPGISETADPLAANLDIHFCTQPEMISLMGEWTNGLDGAVTFWYDDNRVYDAVICVRSDLDQYLRNSVILEELYNGLGPIQDTSLREDSLIYAGYSEPQEPTNIDRLILQLLYHPDVKCGMISAQCEELIRKLYY